jgi:hypothetical protein
VILAHGSGIDDTAFIVAPLLALTALRWLNHRRSLHRADERDTRAVRRSDAAGS